MKRQLFNLLTAGSLLLCVAVGATWARSYFVSDMLRIRPGSWLLVIHTLTDQGNLMCSWTWHDDFGLQPRHAGYSADHFLAEDIYTSWRTSDIRLRVIFQRGGFAAAGHNHYGNGGALIVPLWFVALCTGAVPVVRLAAWLRRRRGVRPGYCRRCRYDLRATPDRCPECGTLARSVPERLLQTEE
jgi:hypothetical protein